MRRFQQGWPLSIDTPIEKLICTIAQMGRDECIEQIQAFRDPPLDFSRRFLDSQTVDQLRHILMAACLQARKRGARKAG